MVSVARNDRRIFVILLGLASVAVAVVPVRRKWVLLGPQIVISLAAIGYTMVRFGVTSDDAVLAVAVLGPRLVIALVRAVR